MGRPAWGRDHTADYARWADYEEYKLTRADDLGITKGFSWDWHDPQWWADEWVDPIASEYGWAPDVIGRLDLPTLWRYKQSISRRRDREGYASWVDYDKNAQETDNPSCKSRGGRPPGLSRKEWEEVLDWAYANSTNYAQFIRQYAGYVPG